MAAELVLGLLPQSTGVLAFHHDAADRNGIFLTVFLAVSISPVFRMGIVLTLTYLVQGMLPVPEITVITWVGISVILLKELLIGFALGFIMNAVT
jgi:flagellar biosynthesis protein FliR